MSGPIITSHLFILRMHRISQILWGKEKKKKKHCLEAEMLVELRDVNEVWNF